MGECSSSRGNLGTWREPLRPPHADSAGNTNAHAHNSSHNTQTEHPAGGADAQCSNNPNATGTPHHSKPTTPSPAPKAEHEPTDYCIQFATANAETAAETTNGPHSPAPHPQPAPLTPTSDTAHCTGPRPDTQPLQGAPEPAPTGRGHCRLSRSRHHEVSNHHRPRPRLATPKAPPRTHRITQRRRTLLLVRPTHVERRNQELG